MKRYLTLKIAAKSFHYVLMSKGETKELSLGGQPSEEWTSLWYMKEARVGALLLFPLAAYGAWKTSQRTKILKQKHFYVFNIDSLQITDGLLDFRSENCYSSTCLISSLQNAHSKQNEAANSDSIHNEDFPVVENCFKGTALPLTVTNNWHWRLLP